jgi:hypothetical protein
MITKILCILPLFALTTGCFNGGQNKTSSNIDSVTIWQNDMVNGQVHNSEIIEIDCDSIYEGKGYKLRLISLDSIKENEMDYSFVLIITKQVNGQISEIYRDTIESTAQVVKFCDYNNDNIKDILIQNISDARSNWTYNLYLVDHKLDKMRKVKGFNEIKNPNFLSEYNLVDNYVNSGINWTGFYKIQADTIIDFGIVIEDNQTEDGTYQNDCKKEIDRILLN